MGGGGSSPWGRIVPLPAVYNAGEAPADRIPAGSGPWILERRSGDGFQRIGLYGTIVDAMKAIDEQVALGHGTPQDYEVELVPKKGASTRQVVTKVIAWVFPVSLIVACFALATVNIVLAVAIALAVTALAAIGAWGVQKIRHRS